MTEPCRVVTILGVLLPIAGGCNAILGIEDHSLAPDSGARSAPDSITQAACFVMPNPATARLPRPASYTDNPADGTVTDNVSGLVWQRAVDNTTYNQRMAIEFCQNKARGPWRLPTRIELVSLVDSTVAKPGPTINSIFSNTPRARFWTSSHAPSDTSIGWYVSFGTPDSSPGAPNDGSTDGSTHQERDVEHAFYNVRCVRDAPPGCAAPRYEPQQDGLVRDGYTRLTWQQSVASQRSWNEARSYCASLGAGWRLPSLTEQQTIIDETRQDPSVDPDAFPGTPVGLFWTSSPQAGAPDSAWYVTSIHGHADTDRVTTPYWVRCVR